MSHRRLLSAGLAATTGLLAAALAPAAAQAGTILQTASNCPTETLSQPFLPWGDPSEYTLVPGGSFESGTPSWSLSGGAAVVSGNESYYVGGSSDDQSLSLPAGSSATSVPMCIAADDPDMRFFDRNTGDPGGTLDVAVNFATVFGSTVSLPVGHLTGSGEWAPTLPVPVVANDLALSGQTPVTFTFTPSGGDWQIDDVYVDPNGRGG